MPFSLLSLIASNGTTDAVDTVRLSFEANSESWFRLVKYSGYAVAFGCLLEAPETFVTIKRWWSLRFRDEKHEETDKDQKSWIVPLAAIGLIIIVLGIVAETYCEGKVSDVEADLRAHESDKITEAEDKAASAIREAGSAKDSTVIASTAASGAQSASAGAVDSADSALRTAGNARKEADTFEADIVSAKTQAALAESHLAEALRQAASAEQELRDIRSPRSLTDAKSLIAELSRFKGTEYKLNVFQDEESIQFLKLVNSALVNAGWIRKPAAYHLGITSLNVFGQDPNDSIPVCFETGIVMHFHSKDSSKAMESMPLKSLPIVLQAAVGGRDALRTHISPINARSAGDVIIDQEQADEPITICVGKKP